MKHIAILNYIQTDNHEN